MTTCLAVLAAPLVGSAQQPSPQAPHAPQAPQAFPPAAGSRPDASAPTDAQKEEARQRFKRSLELADDGDFDAALVELRKAYDLAPSYRLLYNVGIVYQQLKDYARAFDAFERYLAEGGAEIPAERLADVKTRTDRLRARVAFLDVSSSDQGADVSVDDLVLGRTPLAKPLRVNSGRRKVTVSLPGRTAQSRVVELAGGESKAVAFDFNVATAPPPESKSIVPYVSWGVTLALAGGATVVGLSALKAADDYDAKAGQRGIQASDLDSARKKAHTLGLVTDIVSGAAIAAAGVSIYFTIKPPKSGREKAPPAQQVGVYTNGTITGVKYLF